MKPVLEAVKLSKRYGHHQALTDCDLNIPQGRVIGLVGPNGAGKSTLLNMACGLIRPTSGTIRVLGAEPAASPAHLAKVGFVAQDTPVYAQLTVADHLRLGAKLNPTWDGLLARRRIEQIGLNPKHKAGRLSGGQRAQLALTIAAAKRPELLIFDEPAAALDPLSRSAFLDNLMESVTDLGASAILSSHALADVERVCDYLIVLADSRIQAAGDISELLATHHRLVGTGYDLATVPTGVEAIHADRAPQENTAIVRADRAQLIGGPWRVEAVDLEELVLAYMTRASHATTQPIPMPKGANR